MGDESRLDKMPPALRRLAANSPPLSAKEFHAATLTYLAVLGEVLEAADRKPQGLLALAILEDAREMIEQRVPLEPEAPGNAHRQHVLILHQFVVEGYHYQKKLNLDGKAH